MSNVLPEAAGPALRLLRRAVGFTLRWAEKSGSNFEHGVWGELVVDGRLGWGDVLCYRSG